MRLALNADINAGGTAKVPPRWRGLGFGLAVKKCYRAAMTLPTLDEREELMDFAERLADASGDAILPHFRRLSTVHNKALVGFDPVTDADRAAERAIRALIEASYPDHGVLGEEFGETNPEAPLRWVIDPIDGTRAFLAGLPLWGTLIALTHNGVPVLGVLDQPYLGERFTGGAGPARLRTRFGRLPLATRPLQSLGEAILSTTDPDLFTGPERGAYEAVKAAARLTRLGCDCYAYGMLAAGGIDLVIESGLKPYDILALIPIVEGAGGRLTNWAGGSACAGGQVIAAATPEVHERALNLLRPAAITPS